MRLLGRQIEPDGREDRGISAFLEGLDSEEPIVGKEGETDLIHELGESLGGGGDHIADHELMRIMEQSKKTQAIGGTIFQRSIMHMHGMFRD